MKKINFLNLFEYILSLFLVIDVYSIWTRANFISYSMQNIILITLLVVLIFISIEKYSKYSMKNVMFILFIIIYLIIYVIFNNGDFKNYIIKFVIILPLLTIYLFLQFKMKNKYSIIKKISNIMLIISVTSLFFYVFGTTLAIIKPNEFINIKWGMEKRIPSYFNLYYETQKINILGFTIVRNTGIFTEAPMYVFVLIICLFEKVFIEKNRKKVLIIIVTILTTFSTTGIILMSIILISNIVLNKSNTSIKKIIILPIAIFIGLVISANFLISKYMESSYNINSSLNIRIDDYRAGIKAWKDNPIFGSGYGTTEITNKYISSSRNEYQTGTSSGIMVLIAQGGIYISSIYIVFILLQIRYSFLYKDYKITILSIVFIILLFVTNVAYRNIVLYFISLAFSHAICQNKQSNDRRINFESK